MERELAGDQERQRLGSIHAVSTGRVWAYRPCLGLGSGRATRGPRSTSEAN
jgi:hypothetical protein